SFDQVIPMGSERSTGRCLDLGYVLVRTKLPPACASGAEAGIDKDILVVPVELQQGPHDFLSIDANPRHSLVQTLQENPDTHSVIPPSLRQSGRQRPS